MESCIINDTKENWIPVKTVARLKNVTERAVRFSLKKYTYRESVIKKGYEILLSSLESDVQERYKNEQYKNLIFNELDIQEPVANTIRVIPEELKRVALAKLDLLKLWHKFRREHRVKSKANKEFLELYNTGEYYTNIFQTLGKVSSIGTLYRWQALLKDIKSDDWTRLVPNYNYAGEYRTSLSDEEIRIFMKILLNQNKFSIGKAVGLTKNILQKRGFDRIPSDITFRRYADWFKSRNYDRWILAREGLKSLRDKVEPFIVRDASVLDVSDVLVADGHRLSFQVINPFTGKPVRAVLVGFLDWKSGALVGYDIMLEENTQCIASALRNAIIKLGKIPKIVYQDNGKAFKAKFFSGSEDFEELGFTGIYGNLGIQPVYAKPYNARAKVIERFFLEFQEGFEKLLPSYIGSSIAERPAYLKRNEKLHKEIHNGYVPTIREVITLINIWLEYKHSQPCSNVEGKTIQQVLDEAKKENIEIDKLDDLMMAQEIKNIGRNGIRFLKVDYYDDNLYGLRDKVLIKYSLFDLSYIKIYNLKGKYLCRARRVEPTHPMAAHLGTIKDVEDFRQKIVKQKRLRNKTLKAVRKFFTEEDFKVLEEQFDADYIENNSNKVVENLDKNETKLIEPQIVEEETSKPLRPIFSSRYERFEWHLKHGCHSQEDRSWFSEYKNSDEYQTIYEV